MKQRIPFKGMLQRSDRGVGNMEEFLKRCKLAFIIIGTIIGFFCWILLSVLILKEYGETVGYLSSAVIMLFVVVVLMDRSEKRLKKEIYDLQIENQKKNMIIAEIQFEKEKKNNTIISAPMFEIRNTKCKKNYRNLQAVLKNVSNNEIGSLGTVSFEVLSESKVITKSDKVEINLILYFSSGVIKVAFNNKKDLNKLIKDNVSNKICFVWKFLCDDTYGKRHYYKATLDVDDLDNLSKELWSVEKVG